MDNLVKEISDVVNLLPEKQKLEYLKVYDIIKSVMQLCPETSNLVIACIGARLSAGMDI